MSTEKVLVKKLTNKSISLKNIVEDIKSLYEELLLLKKDNFRGNNYSEIEFNKNEKLQLVKWRDKDVYDFTHFNLNKSCLKGAFEIVDDNINILAIYEFDFGIFTRENSLSDFIYRGIPLK